MAIPTLTFSNGYTIPVLGLGTWKSKPSEVKEAVEEAIDAGYRYIDCARIYMNETEVGEAIRNKINQGVVSREDLFITSKLWNSHHSPEYVMVGCKQSLEKLGVGYLDLYLMHWPTAFLEGCDLWPKDEAGNSKESDVDFVETWGKMEELVDKGLVKSIGISNFNSQQIQRLWDAARIKPVNLQIECHPYLTQKPLRDLCKEKDITITAYSPLGSNDSPYRNADTPNVLKDTKLKEIADRYGKTVAQVILRFLVQTGMNVIPKSVNPGRIRENFAIFDFDLSEDDVTAIEDLNKNLRTCPFPDIKGFKEYPFNIEF